ncbi:exonuclease/endonuclease/phosphatase family protein, partial [Escherichia coli]|uniref:exonuclease/endonuclease/phosphatase family protein n=1 Tax=Escherichia coli TaxID=562 RepID=UPI00291627F6
MMGRITVLQANLHRSDLANSLLTHIKFETKAEVLLISEQYTNWTVKTWFRDKLGTAAIYVDPKTIREDANGAEEGFVWVKSRNVTYVSCYFTPNSTADTFRRRLDLLEDSVRRMEGDVVVAGDFNAKALEWGMPLQDSRGGYIMEMADRLGLTVLNTGSTPTFRRGASGTIPDVSFASENLSRKVSDWKVLETYNGSDHQYITFQIHDGSQSSRRNVARPVRWNVAKLDSEKLVQVLQQGSDYLPDATTATGNADAAEVLVKETMSLIHRACDASMPRKGSRHHKRPAYWWNDEIARTRSEALSLRRSSQRARKKNSPASDLLSAQ